MRPPETSIHSRGTTSRKGLSLFFVRVLPYREFYDLIAASAVSACLRKPGGRSTTFGRQHPMHSDLRWGKNLPVAHQPSGPVQGRFGYCVQVVPGFGPWVHFAVKRPVFLYSVGSLFRCFPAGWPARNSRGLLSSGPEDPRPLGEPVRSPQGPSGKKSEKDQGRTGCIPGFCIKFVRKYPAL